MSTLVGRRVARDDERAAAAALGDQPVAGRVGLVPRCETPEVLRVRGLPGALGRNADGGRPGLLVPPGDAPAFAAALRRWLGEPGLRQQLRRAAGERRMTLSDWSVTSDRISRVLTEVTT